MTNATNHVKGPAGDLEVTGERLGKWLGCSASNVASLARDGTISKVGPNRYPLFRSVRAYCEHMRRLVVGKGAGTAAAERARLLKASAEHQELKTRRLAGQLVAVEDVQSQWVAAMFRTRAALLAVPSRVQQTAPHLTAGDVASIDAEIRAALTALADGEGKPSETDGFRLKADEEPAQNPVA